MIDIILSCRCTRKLKKELRLAGANEIGGVMAGEHLADGKFLVKDLSVQRSGTISSFARDPVQHRKYMRRFHLLTGNNTERFNYLGEWHSHPSFLALPSTPDLRTMQAEIEDREQTASFLVLLVIKLGRDGGLIGSTHAFRRRYLPIRVNLKAAPGVTVREEAPITAPGPLRAWLRFVG
ncbi:Mov34/MPN/PAD-1 family protein [Methylibium petroleiphilum]|uniref:Mov34/MPN/PAD-1 family protein n=1 Tax=Methylibium petroleiphilum TaxID=105560 RepID=UPI003D2B06F0